jgi:hypothetical protein
LRLLQAGQWPSFISESLWQMPQAWTSIRTQPAAGSGDSENCLRESV